MTANPPFPDSQVYFRLRKPPNPGPALFLDRDGVIVEEIGYLHRPQDIRYIPGSLSAIAHANSHGIPVILVTNQAGIGRGYYTWNEFDQVQHAIEDELKAAGGWFDAVCACGSVEDHPYRKPNPGMITNAASQMSIDLSRSWLIGDKILDLEAASNARLAGATLVRTGYGAELERHLETARQTWHNPIELAVENDLNAALERLRASGRL